MKDREKKKVEKEPIDYECSPYVKTTIVLFLISNLFLIFGTAAMCYQWIPGAFLMFIIYTILVVKIAREVYHQDRIDYGNYMRIRNGFNLQAKEIEKISDKLDHKMDKPVEVKATNVRPGSHPSDDYYKMIGKKGVTDVDRRSKDQRAP